MIKKLRIKFIAIIMVIVTLMMGIIFWLLYSNMQKDLEERAMSMLRAVVSEPRIGTRPGFPGGDFLLPYMLLELDSNGELEEASGGFYDLSDTEYLEEILQAVNESPSEMGVLKDLGLRYLRRSTPRGTTIALCDTENDRNILSDMERSLALVGGAGFLVFLGIAVLFSAWAVKPVDKAWKEQKQFIADASHELKTPLTVIMTNAELLQSPDFDSESRRQFQDSILIMSRQMRSLVEKMLELARADNQSVQLSTSDIDFSSLAEEAALSFEGIFYEKNLSLDTEITPGIRVRGNLQSLRQVLDILLDNAGKYSTPGGQTKVSLTASMGKCRLSVSNPGPAISSADLKNIFARFYRVDAARSRDGSFGLGLSIAKQIVQQHHGKIWAESSSGINTFSIELAAI